MPKDEFHVQGMSEHAVFGVRKTDDGESEAVITRAEGRPLYPGAEVVRAQPRSNGSIWDIKTVYKDASPTHEGPARVSTPQFRENFDQIFGSKSQNHDVN